MTVNKSTGAGSSACPTKRITRTAGWYVVWYWDDDETFTNMKFMDYDDAVEFAKEHP